MRHWLGSVAAILIAAFLLIGAGLFARVRSKQLMVTTESGAAAVFDTAAARRIQWQTVGASSYARNCANCHGDAGEGWDQYPPLSGAAAQATVPDGREYLIDLHIYGLDSDRRIPMPPMGHIPPTELAAAMNHVLTQFGGDVGQSVELFSPAEVRARLGQRLTPRQVHERRLSSATARPRGR